MKDFLNHTTDLGDLVELFLLTEDGELLSGDEMIMTEELLKDLNDPDLVESGRVVFIKK